MGNNDDVLPEGILADDVLLKGPAFLVTERGECMVLNPTGHYDTEQAKKLINALGVLPIWLMQGLAAGETAKDALTSRYGIDTPPMIGSTTSDKGVHSYRGDEDTHPMAAIETGDEIARRVPPVGKNTQRRVR